MFQMDGRTESEPPFDLHASTCAPVWPAINKQISQIIYETASANNKGSEKVITYITLKRWMPYHTLCKI